MTRIWRSLRQILELEETKTTNKHAKGNEEEALVLNSRRILRNISRNKTMTLQPSSEDYATTIKATSSDTAPPTSPVPEMQPTPPTMHTTKRRQWKNLTNLIPTL